MLLIICVKLWFTTVFLLALVPCQIWLYFVQSFPCLFVGFNVRVEYVSFVKLVTSSRLARKWTTRKRPHEKHILGSCIDLCQVGFRESLRGLANSRVTHETLYLHDFKECFPHFFYTHYISSHYPRNCKEIFQIKNPSITLES